MFADVLAGDRRWSGHCWSPKLALEIENALSASPDNGCTRATSCAAVASVPRMLLSL